MSESSVPRLADAEVLVRRVGFGSVSVLQAGLGVRTAEALTLIRAMQGSVLSIAPPHNGRYSLATSTPGASPARQYVVSARVRVVGPGYRLDEAVHSACSDSDMTLARIALEVLVREYGLDEAKARVDLLMRGIKASAEKKAPPVGT